MGKTRATILSALMLCVAASSVFARNVWHWTVPQLVWDYAGGRGGTDTSNVYFYLSKNNGSHAVAMTAYDSSGTMQVWTSILAERWEDPWSPAGAIRAYEYSDVGTDWGHWQASGTWPFIPQHPDEEEMKAVNCHASCNASYKTFSWCAPHGVEGHNHPLGFGSDGDPDPDLTNQEWGFWDPPHPFHYHTDSLANDSGVAVALFRYPDSLKRGCAVYVTWDCEDDYYVLAGEYTTNGGSTWYAHDHTPSHIDVSDDPCFSHPSLATNDENGTDVYLAYELTDQYSVPHVMFRKSTSCGEYWASATTLADNAVEPCIAALGQRVFVCWTTTDNSSRIYCKYSTNGGGAPGRMDTRIVECSMKPEVRFGYREEAAADLLT